MRFSDEALTQIADLRRHYRRLGRFDASRNLTLALRVASQQIEAKDFVSAPRPYPQLARPGQAWTKAGRYWIACSTTAPFIVVAVFFETADIPSRL